METGFNQLPAPIIIMYNNKKFKAVSNSDNGEISGDIIFHYIQRGNILTCEYSGGKIKAGQLLGIVDDKGNIDMRYQQINESGMIMTGLCKSTPEILREGKIRLHEDWQWTSGDQSRGSSILEEI